MRKGNVKNPEKTNLQVCEIRKPSESDFIDWLFPTDGIPPPFDDGYEDGV